MIGNIGFKLAEYAVYLIVIIALLWKAVQIFYDFVDYVKGKRKEKESENENGKKMGIDWV